MKQIAFAVAALLFALPAFAKDKFRPAAEKKIPGQYVVVLNDAVIDVDAIADMLSRTHAGLVDRLYTSLSA